MTQTRLSPSTNASCHPPGQTTQVETLLQASARGDEAAFSSFYEQTSPLVYSLVLRAFTDRPSADTAMVEIYTTIWRRAADFAPSAGSAWSWTLSLVGEVMANNVVPGSWPHRSPPPG